MTRTDKPTKAQIAALRSCGCAPHLPDRRLARTFDALYRRKLVDVAIERGDGYQRAGYVLTTAGRVVLDEADIATA